MWDFLTTCVNNLILALFQTYWFSKQIAIFSQALFHAFTRSVSRSANCSFTILWVPTGNVDVVLVPCNAWWPYIFHHLHCSFINFVWCIYLVLLRPRKFQGKWVEKKVSPPCGIQFSDQSRIIETVYAQLVVYACGISIEGAWTQVQVTQPLDFRYTLRVWILL